MRILALAAATAAALAFTAPAFTTPALAQADVKVKIGERHHDRGRHEGWRHREVKRVVIHSDRGRHEGWRHRDRGMHKTVIIKRGNGTTVIKKKFEG